MGILGGESQIIGVPDPTLPSECQTPANFKWDDDIRAYYEFDSKQRRTKNNNNMRRPRAGRVALSLLLAGQATPLAAGPTANARQAASCTELSTTTPGWLISNAMSSDWPGAGGGRVQLFANHVPTGETSSCNVQYRMNATSGEIIDHDPAAEHECLDFSGTTALNTSVQLDMDTLLLTVRSTWVCEQDGDAAARYAATGSANLQRDTSPGACLIEPTLYGDSITCPIADVEVEGELLETS
ncbi:hypothetical protein DL769_008032 [Monosporascus sp. CRB-8-3]|nr:hypothetical protein DL769_008032 [Monosporascus sp. CRB-8-3]